MRKLFTFFAALLCAASVSAATTVKIGELWYSLGTTTATVLADQETGKPTYTPLLSVTIPSQVTYADHNYTVTTIGTSAFEGMTNLETVVLPNTITTINTDAFYGCVRLNSINLPEGLVTISLRAFYNCNLASITIPSTVTTVGDAAFKSNPTTTITWLPITCSIGTDDSAPFYSTSSKVTKITFGNQVKTIPAYLCKNMSLLDTVVLPPSVNSLGQYSFMGCSSLKSINLPVTQKTLPVSFFEGCTSLDSIHLPATLTTISTDAFYGCTSLKKVHLHEGLVTIGTRAFYNCKLDSIVVPSTVTTVGDAAFKSNPTTQVQWLPIDCTIGEDESAPFYSTTSKITKFMFGDQVEVVPSYICKNMNLLDTIVLPPSVNRLGVRAFMNCSKLQSINLPVTQKTLPVSIFEGCTSLDSIHLPATLTTISSDAFYGCTSLKKVNLNEGLVTIGTRAFYNCKLDSITIPSTVTSIGNAAFKSNPTTKVIWLPANCTAGSSDSAPFYSTSSKITSFVFGDQVQTIPAYLCYNMSLLDSVKIPETVTSIGRNTFMSCTSLDSLIFPHGLKTIATSILEGCTSLQKVVIPPSVTTINTDAFYGCSGLQQIYNYAYTPQTIVERTVNNVNKNTCVLYVPMDYISLYQAKDVWKGFLNIIGVATDLQYEDKNITVTYRKKDGDPLYMEQQLWSVPVAPLVEGFTFLRWEIQAGNLEDGIILQAIYQSNDPTDAPAVYTNPEDPTQKLIREGNVYILRDDKMYTIQGQRVH